MIKKESQPDNTREGRLIYGAICRSEGYTQDILPMSYHFVNFLINHYTFCTPCAKFVCRQTMYLNPQAHKQNN